MHWELKGELFHQSWDHNGRAGRSAPLVYRVELQHEDSTHTVVNAQAFNQAIGKKTSQHLIRHFIHLSMCKCDVTLLGASSFAYHMPRSRSKLSKCLSNLPTYSICCILCGIVTHLSLLQIHSLCLRSALKKQFDAIPDPVLLVCSSPLHVNPFFPSFFRDQEPDPFDTASSPQYDSRS